MGRVRWAEIYDENALKGFHLRDFLSQSPRGIKEQSYCQIIFDKHAFNSNPEKLSSGFVSGGKQYQASGMKFVEVSLL